MPAVTALRRLPSRSRGASALILANQHGSQPSARSAKGAGRRHAVVRCSLCEALTKPPFAAGRWSVVTRRHLDVVMALARKQWELAAAARHAALEAGGLLGWVDAVDADVEVGRVPSGCPGG